MRGDNSLIGSLFDKAGIGADNARQAIFNAWNAIKDFLLKACGYHLPDGGGDVFDGVPGSLPVASEHAGKEIDDAGDVI